ncbi:MAG: uncharacterized protein JWP44_1645 [Mucilaginibacter sp.]|nr:uncharacterized protein [Mucilaginibacter sp.]
MPRLPPHHWITARSLKMRNTRILHSKLAGRKTARQPKTELEKRTAALSRWLHTYLSMISLVILLFFAVTGFTLNHADWFGNKPQVKKYNGSMNLKWVNTKDTSAVPKLDIVEFLRKTNGIKGAVNDFRIEDGDVSVSFNGPGYAADIYIDRSNGKYKITETRFGLVAVLNDLHKGRDAGKGWAIVIDIAAMFMIVISLTGIIMICFMNKKRLNGLLLALIGFIVVYLIYRLFVK